MDERKQSFKLIKKFLFLLSICAFVFLTYAAYVYFGLTQIEDPRKCFTTSMYQVKLCPQSQNYTRFKQVPNHFMRALILSEDGSFYSHKGLDWFEIKESFRRNFSEWRFARGGSTITQQLAKNLYLTKEKSINRKIKEFFLAQQIEKYLSKSQILEKYINVVEFGPNIFGIQKASYHYFGKAVESLNVLESVYLVSLLPSPVRYSRSFKSKKLSRINLSRMKTILNRLYRTKRISDEIFVFCKTLLDSHDWPFPHYTNPFEEAFQTVEDELMSELDSGFSEESKNQDYEEEVIKAVKEVTEEQKENFEPIPEVDKSEDEDPSVLENSNSEEFEEDSNSTTESPDQENRINIENDKK